MKGHTRKPTWRLIVVLGLLLLQSVSVDARSRSPRLRQMRHLTRALLAAPGRFARQNGIHLPVETIWLRHAESEGNVDHKVYRTKKDASIEITKGGKSDTKRMGRKLADHLIQERWILPTDTRGASALRRRLTAWRQPRIRLHVSSYLRTRQSADAMLEGLYVRLDELGMSRGYVDAFLDRRESDSIVEQNFGLMDGHSTDDLQSVSKAIAQNGYVAPPRVPDWFLREGRGSEKDWAIMVHAMPGHWLYEKGLETPDGKYWAKPPDGESRADVSRRVGMGFFGTLWRDLYRNGIRLHLVMAHGTVNRVGAQKWANLPGSWVDRQPNPLNASGIHIRKPSRGPSVLVDANGEEHPMSAEQDLIYALPGFSYQ